MGLKVNHNAKSVGPKPFNLEPLNTAEDGAGHHHPAGFEGLGPRRPGLQALHKPYNNWNHGDPRGKENGQMESALVHGLEGLRLAMQGERFGKPNPDIKKQQL